MMKTYSRKSTQQVMEQYCYPKEAEQGSVTAADSLLLGQLDDVPRLIASPHSTALVEEAGDDHNGDKSLVPHQIKAGHVYEINHAQLPNRTPAQLKSIRVAMVSEITEISVALRYPSMESLRAFFNYSKRETHPTLDSKFVMGTTVAALVLNRLVPTEVFLEQKNVEAFWVINSSGSESVERGDNATHKKGGCASELKGNGMISWGVRRQVKYLSRHNGKDGNAQNSSSSFVNGVEGESTEGGKINIEGFKVIGVESKEHGKYEVEEECDEDEEEDEENVGEEEAEEDEDEDEVKEEEEEEEEEEKVKKSDNNLKRRRYPFRNNVVKKAKKVKTEVTIKQKTKKTAIKKKKGQSKFKEALVLRDPKNRWSAERYKLAEENLLRVMKSKVAMAKKPILRPQLRAEARKKIGDTGLLDHLLKHMAGKLAPGGEERFRRRHNPDGAMEYWLERADLMNIRKEAGVSDPYWVPPSGWKPGDPPTQDPACAREVRLLREEISEIKKDLARIQEVTKKEMEEQLEIFRREIEASIHSDHNIQLNLPLVNSCISSKSDFDHAPISMLENCQNKLMAVSDCLETLEESMKKPAPKIDERATTKDSSLMVESGHTKSKQQIVQGVLIVEPPNTTTTAQTEATPAEVKAAKIQRLKSGFRLCKPQGTFLWPNMVKSNTTNDSCSGNKMMTSPQLVQVEVPTPPSVSSSTASAPPQLPYLTSLVKPLAEKRVVTISTVSNGQYNPNAMPLVSHASPSPKMEPWHNTATEPRNAIDHDPKECYVFSSTSFPREASNWLQLSSFKSGSDESRHG